MPTQPQKPEIMSPAGHWPQLHAAVEAGADAVYFGLKHFSARAKVGFTLSDLPEAIRTLHARGVAGYVTFNTLVFEHETSEAARVIAAIAEAGADAIIVQDFGMVRLAREIAPVMTLHASTQMSVTEIGGVRLAQRHGLSRVTLARELSLAEVKAIAAATDCELEIFVHGALCVAYSGQCFSSEAWGGRSANRGQCAQACRLPYELEVDGRIEPLGDARYLLSPGDLFALHQIPEVLSAGVAALKIEGRYKDAGYVALATSAYRRAVDDAWAARPLSVTPAGEIHLAHVYSRGWGPFFLTGTNHQSVVQGRAPRHRGVLVGRVARVEHGLVAIEPEPAHQSVPIEPGDGIVFDAASWRSPQEDEEGGRLYAVQPALDGTLELRFANGAIRFPRIRPGDLVWRTHSPAADRAAKPFLEPSSPVARQPVTVHVVAAEGRPLLTRWSLDNGPAVHVEIASAEPLGPAQARPLCHDLLNDQLGRLGATPYRLSTLTCEIHGAPFAPVSVLNRLRRDAVAALAALQRPTPIPTFPRGAPRGGQPDPSQQQFPDFQPAKPLIHKSLFHGGQPDPSHPQLHLLVRNPAHLDAAIPLAPSSITLDYLDLYGLRPSVERLLDSGIPVRVAAPRILKPGEQRIVDFLLSLGCPLLIRSAGLLEELQGRPHSPLTGDFSLNAANASSATLFLEMGLNRLTPTHDLNGDQVAALARAAGPGRIEVVAYQHLPVFHTEHCVFCRFLSTGTTYKDCGRPCESRRVALRDASGRAHPVLADVGCRNTVFGAEAQEASRHLESWLAAGIRHFRLEFVHESPETLTRVVRAFERTLAGSIPFARLTAELKAAAPEGTTEGSLYVPEGYMSLPILD
jgi:putative protease